MSKKCVVPNCGKSSRKHPELSFFSFTSNKKLRQKWIKDIEYNTGFMLEPQTFEPERTRICSAHFRPEDVFIAESGAKFRRRDACPTIFDQSYKIYAPVFDEGVLKLCRICLKAKGLSELSLQNCLPKSSISIQRAVEKAFDIDLSRNPNYPQTICARCYNLVVTSYVLKLEIIKSTLKLQKLSQNNYKWVDANPIVPKQELEIVETHEKPTFQFISQDVEMKDEPEEKVVINQQQIFAESINKELTEDELLALQSHSNEDSDDDENVQYIAIVKDDESVDVDEFIITIENDESPKKVEVPQKPKRPPSPPIDIEKLLKEALEREEKEKEKQQEEMKNKPALPKYKRLHPLTRIGNNRSENLRQDMVARRKCKKCNFTAGHALDLFRHVDESNENCIELYEPTQECYICRKKFMLLTMKEKHVIRDHKDMELTGECKTCGKYKEIFKQPLNFERHCREHCVPPDYVCAKCGKGFYRKDYFDNHMANHGPNFFCCDLCEYKTPAKILLLAHMKKHNNETRTVCDRCSKAVRNIDDHLFCTHKIAKIAYHCKSCDYCFHLRSVFKKHITGCNGPRGKKYPDCVRIHIKELDPSCKISTR